MKLTKKLLLILSVSLLGCADVPNIPVCVELDVDRGYCVWITDDREQEVNNTNKLDGKTWWEMRPTMVLLPPDSWAKIKSFVIKKCEQTKKCNPDEQIKKIEKGLKK